MLSPAPVCFNISDYVGVAIKHDAGSWKRRQVASIGPFVT